MGFQTSVIEQGGFNTIMGMLSDFFIADGAAVPQYDGGEGFDAEDKFQTKGLSPLEAGRFLAVLRGQEYADDLINEFILVTPEEAEDWTLSVPQDMVDKLAALRGKKVSAMAAKFADATSEELGWTAEEFVPLVTELSALARRANELGKRMYLWNCL